MTMKDKEVNTYHGLEIAVIGMSGRYPMANSVDAFWKNIVEAKECISFFSPQELKDGGVDPEHVDNASYVRANSFIEGKESFDFSFFQYTSAEATVMDPQIRIFHECVWTALENAGYNPIEYPGLIGLYASAAPNFKWEIYSNILSQRTEVDDFTLRQLNDKDYIASRIAYKLNLRGPVVNLNSACSSSLLSIHQACKSLLLGECDMALAGGVAVSNASKIGYHYREGMILSPDGHCRAFDEQAKGTVSSEGVGVVVLKRLKNALADGDTIYAVVKGSSVNNDGNRKVGFAAPSLSGQIDVLTKAFKISRVDPASIQYVEAHGTGTPLGDALEIEALQHVFGKSNSRYCGIGSVKTNIGHSDSAAGVAGFIKVVLSLRHQIIPASLHCLSPSKQLNKEGSPFYVNTISKQWEGGVTPRRACVSAFGIGGTNAHIILEESPDSKPLPPSPDKARLFVVSGKSATALQENTKNIIDFVSKHPQTNLDSVAYTLSEGRQAFQYRTALLSTENQRVPHVLFSETEPSSRFKTNPSIAFMFSGQGAQYVNMGKELYDNNSFFKETMDNCFAVAKQYSNIDYKQVIFPTDAANDHTVNNTIHAQPLLFIIEYSLAKLLMQLGIKPTAMIGHSIGEYVAACLSGVFTLQDAMKVVIARGKLMQEMEPGAMLSVALDHKELAPYLDGSVDVAAINTQNSIVLSGSIQAIEVLEKTFATKGIYCQRLITSHAFHSRMMEPMLADFKTVLNGINLNAPSIPFISNLNRNIASAEAVTSASYWVDQLRNTVNFYEGVQLLRNHKCDVFIEIGPGKALTSLLHSIAGEDTDVYITNLIKSKNETEKDDAYFLGKMGKLWCTGVSIHWDTLYDPQDRKRIPLPAYAFDKFTFPAEFNLQKQLASVFQSNPTSRKNTIDDCYFTPQWRRTLLSPYENAVHNRDKIVLLFQNECEWTSQLKERLEKAGTEIICVSAGMRFERTASYQYTLCPEQENQYAEVFRDLKERKIHIDRIIHTWCLASSSLLKEDVLSAIDFQHDLGLYSLQKVAIAASEYWGQDPARLPMDVITSALHKIDDDDCVNVGSATLMGAIKIIPLEFLELNLRNIDIDWLDKLRISDTVEMVYQEIYGEAKVNAVAIRKRSRWTQEFVNVNLKEDAAVETRLKTRGVYVVFGGWGGMGFAIAKHLAKTIKARVILVGRSPFPERSTWKAYKEEHGKSDGTQARIAAILEIEKTGGEIHPFCTDMMDEHALHKLVGSVKEQFGQVNGIIHAAGEIDYGGVILKRSREITEKYMNAKVKGTLLINKIFNAEPVDFIALFSSIGNVLYGNKFGQISYNASNEFMESFANYLNASKPGTHAFAINWCDWKEVGMSVNANRKRYAESSEEASMDEVLQDGLSTEEGVRIFMRILESSLTHVTVSKADLPDKIASMMRTLGEDKRNNFTKYKKIDKGYLLDRPELSSQYVAPQSKVETTLAALWQDLLGYKKIGLQDNFYELGGDSLKAMILLARIQKSLGISVPLKQFLDNPTMSTTATYVDLFTASSHSMQSVHEENEEFIV